MKVKAILAATALVFMAPAVSGCATIDYIFGDTEEKNFRASLAEAEATYSTLVQSATNLLEQGKISEKRADRIDVAITVTGGLLDKVNEAERAGDYTNGQRNLVVVGALLLELAELVQSEIDEEEASI